MSLTRWARWALVGSGLRGTIRPENPENIAGNRFVVRVLCNKWEDILAAHNVCPPH